MAEQVCFSVLLLNLYTIFLFSIDFVMRNACVKPDRADLHSSQQGTSRLPVFNSEQTCVLNDVLPSIRM